MSPVPQNPLRKSRLGLDLEFAIWLSLMTLVNMRSTSLWLDICAIDPTLLDWARNVRQRFLRWGKHCCHGKPFFRVFADLGNLRSMLSSWPGVLKIPGWRKPLAVIEFVPRSTTSNPNVFAVHVVRSGVGQWIVTRRATARLGPESRGTSGRGPKREARGSGSGS